MEIEESGIYFHFFTESWDKVIKYDEGIDYQKIRDSIPETKGVDFLASQKDVLYFIEVKNYRGYRIESKLKIEELDIQIAQKVKDTLAGIVGGARNSTNEKESWKHFLKLISKAKTSIHVFLWMEEDAIPNSKRRKSAVNTLNNKLKQRLSYQQSNRN